MQFSFPEVCPETLQNGGQTDVQQLQTLRIQSTKNFSQRCHASEFPPGQVQNGSQTDAQTDAQDEELAAF